MTMKYREISDLLKRSLSPLSTSDIIVQVYGTLDNNKRRYVNSVLTKLHNSGEIAFVGESPRKCVTAPRKVPLIVGACEICGKDKSIQDLHNGICTMCEDIAEQTVSSTNGTQLISRATKIDHAFGNYHDREQPLNTKKMSSHIRIIRMMIGKPVRVVVSNTGKALHGVLQEIDDDGFAGLQTQNGPATVNTTKAISIEEWFTKIPTRTLNEI